MIALKLGHHGADNPAVTQAGMPTTGEIIADTAGLATVLMNDNTEWVFPRHLLPENVGPGTLLEFYWKDGRPVVLSVAVDGVEFDRRLNRVNRRFNAGVRRLISLR